MHLQGCGHTALFFALLFFRSLYCQLFCIIVNVIRIALFKIKIRYIFVLKISDLSLQRNGRFLLEGADATVFAKQKVGVIGKNGCGKSSLFAIIRGKLGVDGGELSLPPSLTIAHMAQETPGLAISAIDHVLDGDKELREIEQKLEQAEASNDGITIAKLHSRYGAIEGYSAHAKAAQLLHGLGFHHDEFTQPIKSFSGGWRVRLNLAQALMCRSDLLLLDEPTNHLDLDAVVWLENWLHHYQGTLLLISHDRDFINGTCDHIMHFESNTIKIYSGNYDNFEKLRAEQLALQQALHKKQQQSIAHMQSFVDRFQAKASKAKQAQSRVKAIARLQQVSAVHVESSIQFQFREPKQQANPLLALDQVSLGYDDKIILKGIQLTIHPGMRLGLLGPNGAGKSTFIKFLADELSARQGEVIRHPKLKIGYFAQHQVDQLDLEASPLLQLQRIDGKITEQQGRNFLGGFAFHGNKTLEPIHNFSGGEKARLALALIIWQQPNLLLLDEPTNHLDMDMRDALTLALQDFAGAMVLVSHDRYLLRTTVDEFYLIHNKAVSPYKDDLDDYQQQLRQLTQQNNIKEKKPISNNKKQQQLKTQLRSVEKAMAKIQAK